MDEMGNRAVNPVVGNVLLVAVAIVLGMVIATGTLALMDGYGTPTADASFEYTQTPTGLEMKAQAIGTGVDVKLNGRTIGTFKETSAGDSLLIPTAPGDRITVVSKDADQSVLINRQIDERNEIGDFIAYYTFDSGSGSVVKDRSGNDNNGDIHGNTSWISNDSGPGLDFDGSTGYVNIGDLRTPEVSSVDEITIAIKYEIDEGSDIQNLIEHQDSNFAWFIETNGPHGDPHDMEFNIGYQTSRSGSIVAKDIPGSETQIIVGTYDGNEMVFYRNGNRIDSVDVERQVELGKVILAADSDPQTVGQNLDGKIYETRLYYAAFTEDEVGRITDAMKQNSN